MGGTGRGRSAELFRMKPLRNRWIVFGQAEYGAEVTTLRPASCDPELIKKNKKIAQDEEVLHQEDHRGKYWIKQRHLKSPGR